MLILGGQDSEPAWTGGSFVAEEAVLTPAVGGGGGAVPPPTRSSWVTFHGPEASVCWTAGIPTQVL